MDIDRQPVHLEEMGGIGEKEGGSGAADQSEGMLSPIQVIRYDSLANMSQDGMELREDGEEEEVDPELKLIDEKIEVFKQEIDSDIKKNDVQIDEKIATKGKKKT